MYVCTTCKETMKADCKLLANYHIVGNFGTVFNGNWVKIAKFTCKTHQFKLCVCMSMVLSIQITKFKFHQYKLRAVSSNLMLAKVTHHTVDYFVLSIFAPRLPNNLILASSPHFSAWEWVSNSYRSSPQFLQAVL